MTTWERPAAAGQALDGVLLGGRFDATMEPLLSCLGSEYGITSALGRKFIQVSLSKYNPSGYIELPNYCGWLSWLLYADSCVLKDLKLWACQCLRLSNTRLSAMEHLRRKKN